MKAKHLRVALSTSWLIAVIVAIAFVLSSCASLGINLDTKEKKYLAARTELNLLLEQYIMIQDKIADQDHEKAKLAFSSADQALDMWGASISSGGNYDPTKDMMVWLQAKNIILKILTEVQ